MPYMTETEVSNLHQIIDRLEARLAEAEAIIEAAKKLAVSLRTPVYGYDIRKTWECYNKEHEELENLLGGEQKEI